MKREINEIRQNTIAEIGNAQSVVSDYINNGMELDDFAFNQIMASLNKVNTEFDKLKKLCSEL